MSGLTGALDMLGDMGNLDPDGMKIFNQKFQEKITLPSEAVQEVGTSASSLGGTFIAYIFFAIFIVAALIIWFLVGFGSLSWVIGLFLTLLVLTVLVVVAMCLQKSIESQVTATRSSLSGHLGSYTEDFAGNLIAAFSGASDGYSSVVREKKSQNQSKEEMSDRKSKLLKRKIQS